MSNTPEPPATHRIVQGHPSGFEPDENKGGQNGAPKPDGRTAHASDTPPDQSVDFDAEKGDPA